MFWRFGVAGEAGKSVLLYDEVRHRLRNGDGPWIRLPHHPALILSLLLRMQTRGRTVSPREVCVFLELPEGSRVSGHVSELRKKVAEAGVDPDRVIEQLEGKTGYRLARDAQAAPLLEADALQVIEALLASPETATPSVREQLTRLRGMLLLCSAVALGFTAWMVFRPAGGVEVARVDEEGRLGRALVLNPDAREVTSACFALDRELGLRDGEALVVELERLPSSVGSRVVISVERERRAEGQARIPFELGIGKVSTLRIAASALDRGLRAHARRICIGDGESADAAHGSVTFRVHAIRVE